MNNNEKIKLELTPKEISILSKGLLCLIMNSNEARNKIYDMATIDSLDRAAREYQRINKKICDAVPGMEWKHMEEKEMTLQEMIDVSVEKSLEEFKTVPLDRNGCLKKSWYAFPKGTNKNTAYDWFNRHHSNWLAYLMEEVKKEWKEQINM